MAVTIRLDTSGQLETLAQELGKRAQKRIDKALDIFLTKYKYRIFQLGLNSASQKMKPAELPRPKFARNPKSKAKGKRAYKPVPAFARNKVPPYLFRTGTLFDSIDLSAKRSRITIKINYPTPILQGLEERYGKIFNLTQEERDFIADLVAEEIEKELEKLQARGRVSSLI